MRKALATVGVMGLTCLGLATPASAAPPQAIHETITFDVSQGEDAPGQIEASGAINGSGINETTSSRDTGHANHSTELQTFDDGTITIKDSSHGTGDQFDPETCTDTFSSTGPFKVTGGTGAYEGARGHGHATVNGTVTFAQTADGCNFDEPPTGTVVVTVNGKVKL